MPPAADAARADRGGAAAPPRLDHKLRALAAGLGPAVLAPDALDALAAACRGLPSATSRWLILERALGQPEPRADLALAIVPGEDRGRDILAGATGGAGAGGVDASTAAAAAGAGAGAGANAGGALAAGADLSPELLAAPAWRRLRAFARRWRERGSPLWSTVTSLWLELDVASAATAASAAALAPSVFVGARLERGGDSEAVPLDPLGEGLALLLGEARWNDVADRLRATLEALPAGRFAVQVGAMLGRPGEGLRVCVSALPREALSRYLARLGLDPRAAPVDAALGLLGGAVPRFVVQVEVVGAGAALGPRLGVEVPARDLGLPWEALLADLAGRGLCLPAVARALLDAEQASRLPPPDELYAYHWAARSLSHVKLSGTRAGAVSAKAYLSLVQR